MGATGELEVELKIPAPQPDAPGSLLAGYLTVYSRDLSKKQTQAMIVPLVFINYGKHSGEDTHYMSVDRPNDI